MEKNIPDDRLNDYVKGSFEDYTENPATDMWARIEGQLPPSSRRKPFWNTWLSYRWQMAAVVVIMLLITRLVCVEGYYETKLRAVSTQQQQHLQHTLPSAEPLQHLSESDSQKNPSTDSAFSVTSNTEIPVTLSAEKVLTPGSNHAATTGISVKAASTNTLPVQQVTKIDNTELPPLAQLNTVVVKPNSAPEGSDLTASITPAFSKVSTFNALGQRTPLLSFSNNPAPYRIAIPTKKHRQPSGWYAGLSVTPHLTVEKSSQITRPGPVIARRLFISQQQQPQVSSGISLRVGKKINARFALESGIGYQQLSRTASHLARFEYREGQILQNPTGLESRSFDYDLNTYTGAASVSLRMEVSGSDAPAALERVGARITSKESLQILQIPVLGVARLGTGRLKTVVKAGILGNYLMKNNFEITAFRVENNKLRFRSQGGYAVTINRPKHFIWGYQLAAGVEFRLTKNLSLAAMPTVSGDFKRKDNLQGKLPGQMAIGLNMGANWWF